MAAYVRRGAASSEHQASHWHAVDISTLGMMVPAPGQSLLTQPVAFAVPLLLRAARLRSQDFIESAMALAQRPDHPAFCRAAVDYLSRVGHRPAISTLQRLIDRSPDVVRTAATRGLLRLDPQALLDAATRRPAGFAGPLLIIDDLQSIARLIARRVLRRWPGWSVEWRADGHEGIAFAQAHPGTVILSDFHRPGLSGVETLQRLRAAGGLHPICFLSGWVESPPWQPCALMAETALHKPCHPGLMIQALQLMTLTDPEDLVQAAEAGELDSLYATIEADHPFLEAAL